jgi:predicted transcriptional regulator
LNVYVFYNKTEFYATVEPRPSNYYQVKEGFLVADQIRRGSRRNFFMVFNSIFDEWDKFDLDTYDIAVYFCLLRYADNNSREAFPGQAHIAKVTRMSTRRVAKSIKNLKEQELIEVKPQYEKTGGQTSNLYIVYDAHEVIHRGSTTCMGGMHVVQGGVEPGASGGMHEVHTKKTHLKILNEEEALLTQQKDIDSETFFKNIAKMKKVLLTNGKDESES